MIEKAIEKTGYSPSISAQNIRTKVTKLVGVIIPKMSSESCARVTEGISQVLSEEGYELLLVNTANDYRKEVEYLDLFRQNHVDGVILLATVFTQLLKISHISAQTFNPVCGFVIVSKVIYPWNRSSAFRRWFYQYQQQQVLRQGKSPLKADSLRRSQPCLQHRRSYPWQCRHHKYPDLNYT